MIEKSIFSFCSLVFLFDLILMFLVIFDAIFLVFSFAIFVEHELFEFLNIF